MKIILVSVVVVTVFSIGLNSCRVNKFEFPLYEYKNSYPFDVYAIYCVGCKREDNIDSIAEASFKDLAYLNKWNKLNSGEVKVFKEDTMNKNLSRFLKAGDPPVRFFIFNIDSLNNTIIYHDTILREGCQAKSLMPKRQ